MHGLTPLLAAVLAMFLAACASETPPVQPRISAEAARGLAYAELACAACHAIAAADMDSPNLAAPPFAELANTPGMTSIALNAWLHTAHSTMPNVVVSQDQTDDLWAYMLTLRDQR